MLAAFAVLVAGATDLSAPGAVEALRDRVHSCLEARSEALKSLRVVTRTLDARPGQPAGLYLRSDIRVLDSGEFWLEDAHELPGLEWESDPSRYRAIVASKEFVSYSVYDRIVTRKPLRDGSTIRRFESRTFFGAAGWWPEHTDLPCPQIAGCSIDLRDIVKDERYDVSRLDLADGVHRIAFHRAAEDRIVLREDRGWALESRQLTVEGWPFETIEVTDFQCMGQGVWIPLSYVITRRGGHDNGGGDSHRLVTIVGTVDEAEVGALSASDVELRLGPGTFFVDLEEESENWVQTLAGGFDLIASAGDRLEAVQSGGRWRWSHAVVFSAMCGIASGIALVGRRGW